MFIAMATNCRWQALRASPSHDPSPDGRGAGVRGPRLSRTAIEALCGCVREPIELLADLRVREADEPNAIGFEDLRAAGVVVGEPFMLLAVHLDDEFAA